MEKIVDLGGSEVVKFEDLSKFYWIIFVQSVI